jgi:hypothetical protein
LGGLPMSVERHHACSTDIGCGKAPPA